MNPRKRVNRIEKSFRVDRLVEVRTEFVAEHLERMGFHRGEKDDGQLAARRPQFLEFLADAVAVGVRHIDVEDRQQGGLPFDAFERGLSRTGLDHFKASGNQDLLQPCTNGAAVVGDKNLGRGHRITLQKCKDWQPGVMQL